MSHWSSTDEAKHYWNDLSAVTTISEASLLWGIPSTTLQFWCTEGKIASVQPENGSTWLISVRHMIALHGDPIIPDRLCEKLRDITPEVA